MVHLLPRVPTEHTHFRIIINLFIQKRGHAYVPIYRRSISRHSRGPRWWSLAEILVCGSSSPPPVCPPHCKKEKKKSKMLTAELGGDRVCSNSQNPHVVITDIILLWPRPFLKLQILNVFHHLQRAQGTWAECTETSSKRLLKSKDDSPSQYHEPGFHRRWAAQIQP